MSKSYADQALEAEYLDWKCIIGNQLAAYGRIWAIQRYQWG